MAEESTVESFDCNLCPRSFTKKGSLKRHLLAHSRQKDCICEYCSKPFPSKSALQRHLTSHTGVKDFACGICGKKFVRKSNLKTHFGVHINRKDFKCETCGREFSQKSHLQRHMAVHTGEKDYVCVFCWKEFVQKSKLVSHIANHFGRRDFSCETCGKSYLLKSSLKKHEAIHTGRKDFKCQFCEKAFVHKAVWKKHQETHTRKKRTRRPPRKIVKEKPVKAQDVNEELVDSGESVIAKATHSEAAIAMKDVARYTELFMKAESSAIEIRERVDSDDESVEENPLLDVVSEEQAFSENLHDKSSVAKTESDEDESLEKSLFANLTKKQQAFFPEYRKLFQSMLSRHNGSVMRDSFVSKKEDVKEQPMSKEDTAEQEEPDAPLCLVVKKPVGSNTEKVSNNPLDLTSRKKSKFVRKQLIVSECIPIVDDSIDPVCPVVKKQKITLRKSAVNKATGGKIEKKKSAQREGIGMKENMDQPINLKIQSSSLN